MVGSNSHHFLLIQGKNKMRKIFFSLIMTSIILANFSENTFANNYISIEQVGDKVVENSKKPDDITEKPKNPLSKKSLEAVEDEKNKKTSTLDAIAPNDIEVGERARAVSVINTQNSIDDSGKIDEEIDATSIKTK